MENTNFEIENNILTMYNGVNSYVKIPEGVTEIGTEAFDL